MNQNKATINDVFDEFSKAFSSYLPKIEEDHGSNARCLVDILATALMSELILGTMTAATPEVGEAVIGMMQTQNGMFVNLLIKTKAVTPEEYRDAINIYHEYYERAATRVHLTTGVLLPSIKNLLDPQAIYEHLVKSVENKKAEKSLIITE